jgi:ElaB/YqjD/DUF883 family membrane-anchored ribosome-binding protein
MKPTSASFEDRLDSLKESMRNLVEVSGERASALKHRMGDVKDTVFASSKTGVQKVGAFVKGHPIIAIGVAFGVGYLVMRIVRR